MPSMWERFVNWFCRTFGHKRFRHAISGDEVCMRCNRLLSTSYSRGDR